MSKTRHIRWRAGSHGKIDAEVAYKALNRIRAKHAGDLTAEIVVEEARDKDNPLHEQIFDKTVRAAAEEYYLGRARNTLRSLVVVYERKDTPSKAPVEVRAFSTVSEEIGQAGRKTYVYSSTEEALQHPERREYVLGEALAELAAFRKKYAALSELALVFHAIDQLAV